MIRSTTGVKKADKIAAIIKRIEASPLSVDEYFRKHQVPFSRMQYFRYKARLATQGVAGLLDGRGKGNHCKLTPEAEGFLRGMHQRDQELSLKALCMELRFGAFENQSVFV